MLKPTTSNTFFKKTQPVPILVINDREPEYEILWIVDSKINYQQVYKLLYKIIWLEYKDTKDEFKYISTTELTYATDLVSNFHIVYPANFRATKWKSKALQISRKSQVYYLRDTNYTLISGKS